jgi:hypothetical protein
MNHKNNKRIEAWAATGEVMVGSEGVRLFHHREAAYMNVRTEDRLNTPQLRRKQF